MAIYSPLRSRRLAAQQADTTKRLITFKLGGEVFAVSLDRVQKVTTLDRLYGDPHHTGVSLTTYQGQELVVVDVGYRIFGRTPQGLSPDLPERSRIESTDSKDLIKYLLVLQADQVNTAAEIDRQLIGLPIDSAPSIQSMPVSAFQPLPEIYRQHGNIHCVSSFSIDLPDRPSIFLLDIDAIVSGE
jgi:chemotaxis signal transduction protein